MNLIKCAVRPASPGSQSALKSGMHAKNCTLLMLYIHSKEEPSLLILRRFSVHPASLCSDVPCGDLTETGYIQHFYVDGGVFGGFGEIEYHTPFIGYDGQ